MLKIRLHGEEAEVTGMESLLAVLETEGRVRVIDRSYLYADRAPSRRQRCYLDIELIWPDSTEQSI